MDYFWIECECSLLLLQLLNGSIFMPVNYLFAFNSFLFLSIFYFCTFDEYVRLSTPIASCDGQFLFRYLFIKNHNFFSVVVVFE